MKGNRKFHDFLAQKSDNKTLLELTRTHRDSIYRIVARGSTLPLHIQQYLAGHDAIIEALQKGEAEKAGMIMKGHVLEAGQLISGAMAPCPGVPLPDSLLGNADGVSLL